jgi:hypothetical protein
VHSVPVCVLQESAPTVLINLRVCVCVCLCVCVSVRGRGGCNFVGTAEEKSEGVKRCGLTRPH